MKEEKRHEQISGFTMIEVVITIAVVAILAALLVPMISQNIQSARLSRAASDVGTLGKAIVQFRQDTGAWPLYVGGGLRSLLFSDADSTNNGIPDTSAIPPPWDTAVDSDARLSLVYHLVNYNANVQRGPSTDGTPSWNGPYLNDAKPDPWGYAYVVNAQQLWPGNTGNVYVLSVGPDRPVLIETPFDGSPPPADSGDIVFRLK